MAPTADGSCGLPATLGIWIEKAGDDVDHVLTMWMDNVSENVQRLDHIARDVLVDADRLHAGHRIR